MVNNKPTVGKLVFTFQRQVLHNIRLNCVISQIPISHIRGTKVKPVTIAIGLSLSKYSNRFMITFLACVNNIITVAPDQFRKMSYELTVHQRLLKRSLSCVLCVDNGTMCFKCQLWCETKLSGKSTFVLCVQITALLLALNYNISSSISLTHWPLEDATVSTKTYFRKQ